MHVHGIAVCAYATKGDIILCYASVQSFTLVIALILGSQTCLSSAVVCPVFRPLCISLSRWLALITSLQPALSLFRWLSSQLLYRTVFIIAHRLCFSLSRSSFRLPRLLCKHACLSNSWLSLSSILAWCRIRHLSSRSPLAMVSRELLGRQRALSFWPRGKSCVYIRAQCRSCFDHADFSAQNIACGLSTECMKRRAGDGRTYQDP